MHSDEVMSLYGSDFKRIQEIAKSAKTIAFISESSKVRNVGFSENGNKGAINGFKKVIDKTKNQKILTGVFYSDLKSIQQMIEYAVESNKKVVIYGRALNEAIKYLKTHNLINLPNQNLISFTKIQNYDNYVIFACHSSYNLYRLLSQIVQGKDEIIKLSQDMEVYVGAGPIPGAETFYYKLIDDFYKVKIRATYVEKNYAQGASPFKTDIEYMLKTFKPNNLVAIKGQYRDLNALNELGKEFNLKEINTAVLDNGNKIAIEDNKLKKVKENLDLVESIVDGYGIGDVGKSILNERMRMGDSGAIFIGIIIKHKTKKLLNKPAVEITGLTENKEYIDLIDEKLKELLEEILPTTEKEY